jgi:hypothetical protein
MCQQRIYTQQQLRQSVYKSHVSQQWFDLFLVKEESATGSGRHISWNLIWYHLEQQLKGH